MNYGTIKKDSERFDFCEDVKCEDVKCEDVKCENERI